MQSELVRPITHTLIRRTLGWALLCSLVFGGLQAWITYRAAQDNFRLVVRDVASTHVPLLTLAIWDIEPKAVQHQIDLILETPQIGHVVLKTYTGQVFEGRHGQTDPDRPPLVFNIPQPNSPSGSLGSLVLEVDGSVLLHEVTRSVVMVLAQCLILTLLMISMVVFILRRDLETPMRQLATFVTSLQVNNLSSALKIERKGNKHAYDEIDLVVDGFQTLQTSIHRHIETLDATVLERTQQLEAALETLKKLSSIDALTGCFNRRFFDGRFAAEVSRSHRYSHPLSIVFCDADKFKLVNDTHGHGVGDQVLIKLSATLQQALRVGVDWMARYGGEEFIVVLPETPLAQALVIAERLCSTVEQQVHIPLENGAELHVTASFGVAQWQAGETVEQVLHRADGWLYEAKKNGRNQVQPAQS
jgi:diguanylate cyclase (GGDEF)-like protein